MIRRLPQIEIWRSIPTKPSTARWYDRSNGQRLELLLRWWVASNDGEIMDILLDMARNPRGGFSVWEDGKQLLELLGFIPKLSQAPASAKLAAIIEAQILELLSEGVTPDDLEPMAELIDRRQSELPVALVSALDDAIVETLENAASYAAGVDSGSTLDDQKKSLEKLAKRGNIDNLALSKALAAMDRRIDAVREESPTADEPSFPIGAQEKHDTFDDNEIVNLFSSLAATAALEPQ